MAGVDVLVQSTPSLCYSKNVSLRKLTALPEGCDCAAYNSRNELGFLMNTLVS
jgi:hypothetical protein